MKYKKNPNGNQRLKAISNAFGSEITLQIKYSAEDEDEFWV